MKELLRRWLPGHSMRTRLFLLFSVTVVLILLLVLVFIQYFISSDYRERLLRSADQSFEQAYSNLSNNVDTMLYISDIIYYNGDLQRILSERNSGKNREAGEQFREFLQLDKVFDSAEMSDAIVFARIFVPDETFYANNVLHFTSESELAGRADYREFVESSQHEKAFFTTPEDVFLPGRKEAVNIVSLLRTIRTADSLAAPLCVQQISMRTSRIQSIINMSDITSMGLTCLVNRSGKLICASDADSPLLKDLGKIELFPGAEDVDVWRMQPLQGGRYILQEKWLDKAGWKLVFLLPEEEIQAQGRRIALIILTLASLAVIAVFVVSYLIANYYTRQLGRLNKMMRVVQQGNLDIKFREEGADEIGQLFQSFGYMTRELKNLMEEKYRSGAAIKSAQFRALQAQINPHFLYNTLDLINWEAMDHNAPEIAEITRSLASFYRITLNKGRQVVTIEEELRLVRAYVSIENRYFNGAISLTLDVPQELLGLACINILLQPFVENSIMHGIAENPMMQECNIAVRAQRLDGDVLFTVTDDGLGMTQKQIAELLDSGVEDSAHGYGIKNINSRIRLCYGEQYGLQFQSAPGQGTTVLIRIQALTVEQAEEKIG